MERFPILSSAGESPLLENDNSFGIVMLWGMMTLLDFGFEKSFTFPSTKRFARFCGIDVDNSLLSNAPKEMGG
jgi:hypothetical protein